MLRILTTILLTLSINTVNAQDFALQFNGSNSGVVPDSSKLEIVNGPGIVINMWVNADWTTDNFYVFDWADSLDYKQGNDNMRFNLRGIKTGTARFGFYFNSGTATTVEASLLNQNNVWTQISCVINPLSIGSVTSMYSQMIYVNGELKDSTTAIVAAINTGNNSIHINKGSHFRIGSRYAEDTLTYFKGQMDNFQVAAFATSNSQLQASNCNKHYKFPQSLLYYSFDDGRGVNATDSSTSKAHGLVKSAAWVQGSTNPNNRKPLLSFTDTTESPSLGVKLSNTSQYAAFYKWSFGDGITDTRSSTYHSYAYPDTFTVCLEGTNTCGISGDKVCTDVFIICPEPDIKLKSVINGMRVEFSVDTASNHYLYAWDFGDKTWTRNGPKMNETVYEFTENGTYTVCASVRSNCGRDTTCREILIGPNGLVDSKLELGFVVYPNPFNEYLHIENENGANIDIEIVNSLGEYILKGDLTINSTEISTEFWTSGVYLLRISSGGNSSVHRIVKQ